MTGIVFNIQRFCINDGPGIRTTVFFKGCPLHCLWCHNPESHSPETEIMRGADGDEICGIAMTAEEVITEVLKDKIFYDNSGGGLTLSGGEPMLQFDFAYEIVRQAKKNDIHTCIETCGFAKTEDILEIAKSTDIFLYDWKLTNYELHKEYTGVDNGLILKNLKAIDSTASKIVLRCPIIPNVNDTEEHFLGIAKIANSLANILAIEIEPYHFLGNSKYEKLGKIEKLRCFEQPTEQQVEDWIQQMKKHTNVIVKRA